MKKIIVIFVLLLGIYTTKAQTLKTFTGLSISKTEWSDKYFYKYNKRLIGISTGIELNYLEHKYFRLNSKISYIQKGGIQTSSFIDSRFYFNYINFNTTIAFKAPTKILTPYFNIGPRIGYMTSASSYTTEPYYKFYRMSYGLDISIGIDLPISDKLLLGLDYLYNYEINNILLNTDSYKVTAGYFGLFDFCLGLKL